MSIQSVITVIEGLVAKGAQTVTDLKNASISGVINDIKVDVAAVEAAVAPIGAEVESLGAAFGAKLSAIGVALHDVGLASAGPNVPNSQEGPADTNTPAH